ncbi:hypothetical protein [Micromonospora sp. WMMC273]|uniref:hypothetical protein n=1 Tax=Micromonospora sp. WMMC273 TaxID=3015157 RepID=UPI0022B6AB6D|nr:hypothetical protein [Micromonospora sp. WMMC273]MCZ7478910.1 hypothetical protein [Micromonospora sp. WMMC273]
MTDRHSLQGVAPTTAPADPGPAAQVPTVPYAMLNNHGDVFYPATLAEAEHYARVHGAWPLPPSRST